MKQISEYDRRKKGYSALFSFEKKGGQKNWHLKFFYPKSAECHAVCGNKKRDGSCKTYKTGKKMVVGEKGVCAGYKKPDEELANNGRAKY